MPQDSTSTYDPYPTMQDLEKVAENERKSLVSFKDTIADMLIPFSVLLLLSGFAAGFILGLLICKQVMLSNVPH